MIEPPDYRPDWAYVPGETERHAEDLFDPIRETVWRGMTEKELASSKAFLIGMSYLDDGYFWEAHEVMEPVWLSCQPESPARHAVQALIQIANGALKLRMGKPNAVKRILVIVDTLIAQIGKPDDEEVLGVTVGEIRARAKALADTL